MPKTVSGLGFRALCRVPMPLAIFFPMLTGGRMLSGDQSAAISMRGGTTCCSSLKTDKISPVGNVGA